MEDEGEETSRGTGNKSKQEEVTMGKLGFKMRELNSSLSSLASKKITPYIFISHMPQTFNPIHPIPIPILM